METPTLLKIAVRAIWELYRRGKWSLLEALGLERHIYEPLFDSFNLCCLPDLEPHPDPACQHETLIGRISDELSPVALMCLYPDVLETALYMVRYQERRRARLEALLRAIERADQAMYNDLPDRDELPDDGLERDVS